MKNKKALGFNFGDFEIGDLEKLLQPYELAIIIEQETRSRETDILLSNMLEYYVGEEKYDYAIVIRDEINNRAKKKTLR